MLIIPRFFLGTLISENIEKAISIVVTLREGRRDEHDTVNTAFYLNIKLQHGDVPLNKEILLAGWSKLQEQMQSELKPTIRKNLYHSLKKQTFSDQEIELIITLLFDKYSKKGKVTDQDLINQILSSRNITEEEKTNDVT